MTKKTYEAPKLAPIKKGESRVRLGTPAVLPGPTEPDPPKPPQPVIS